MLHARSQYADRSRHDNLSLRMDNDGPVHLRGRRVWIATLAVFYGLPPRRGQLLRLPETPGGQR
jgi:hypothetical protein